MGMSRMDLPSMEEAPPAFSMRSPMGAASNRMRSLALEEGEVMLVKTPFSFTMIWNTSGTMPPV